MAKGTLPTLKKLPTLGTITKENPVYLYRIVLTANKSFGKGSYKEFVVVNAWSNSMDDVFKNCTRHFDFYYNNRIYRNEEVSLEEGVPFINNSVFSIWFKERNDALALAECKKFLEGKIREKRAKLHDQATRVLHDMKFMSSLEVHDVEKLQEARLS